MEKVHYNNSEMAEQYMRLAIECGIWESEYKTIAQYADISKPVLDVGCGAGRITIGLHDIGFCSIYGIDCSENMLMHARKITPAKYCINYVCSDITSEMICPEGFFGVVVFGYNGLMCIQGSNNRRKAVRNIEKMLCSKGIFIFTVQERAVTQEHRRMEFWQNREKSFISQGKSVEDDEFGDLYVEDKGQLVYHHFTSGEEINHLLGTEMSVVDTFMRDSRFKESEEILRRTNNCRFYVCRKE